MQMPALDLWYQSLSQRDRRLVWVVAAGIVILLIFGAVVPLQRSLAKAHVRLAQAQDDLKYIRDHSTDIRNTSLTPAAPGRSLIVTIDNAAKEAGLAASLTNSDPSGRNGLRVKLDRASFDVLVGWIARLNEQHGIRVESATIETANAPGLVNAGIVFRERE
ncbi:MAG TPA: type II secretion system protein M [Steroidobacteraceae bacterium]|nr:type II secretion system protein M [Steroidobacteraceae bacterium]